MTKILLAALAMSATASVAMAEPVKLNTVQADQISAGFLDKLITIQPNVAVIPQVSFSQASATNNGNKGNASAASSASNSAKVHQTNVN